LVCPRSKCTPSRSPPFICKVTRSSKVTTGSAIAGKGGNSVPPDTIFLRAFSCASSCVFSSAVAPARRAPTARLAAVAAACSVFAGPAPARPFVHVHNGIRLDLSGRHATRDGTQVPVTAREWAILETLAHRSGRVTTRAELLENVWGNSSESAGNSLEVLVARLRKKFGPDLIQTLRREGYSLSGEAQRGPDQ